MALQEVLGGMGGRQEVWEACTGSRRQQAGGGARHVRWCCRGSTCWSAAMSVRLQSGRFSEKQSSYYARSRNSDGFSEVQTLPTLFASPEVVSEASAVTTVCSMPLLQKRNQVFERVFCAYVQPATHCRCCAPAAAPVQLETMTKALNPFPVRRKSNGHPRSVFHSSTA